MRSTKKVTVVCSGLVSGYAAGGIVTVSVADCEQVRGCNEELPAVLRRPALRRREAFRHGRRPRRRRPHHLLPRVEGRRLHLGAVDVLQLRRVALLQRLSSLAPAAAAAAARTAVSAQHAPHGYRATYRVRRVARAAVDPRLTGVVARPRRRVAEAQWRSGARTTTTVEVSGDEQRTESASVRVAGKTGVNAEAS